MQSRTEISRSLTYDNSVLFQNIYNDLCSTLSLLFYFFLFDGGPFINSLALMRWLGSNPKQNLILLFWED